MPTHIKHVLKEFLEEKKKEQQQQKKIEKIVELVVGEDIKKHIALKKIFKGQAIFCSDSSNFSYAFNLKKEEILKKIKKVFPSVNKIKIEPR